MLVGIIAANNIRISPYVFTYTNILDGLGVDYEVVFPNRNPAFDDQYTFATCKVDWDSNTSKLKNYLSYSKIIKEQSLKKYDFLVVLTAVNGVFFYRWLTRHFAGKYILDIRDYSYENIWAYRVIERRVINKAAAVVLSSPKYKVFLPIHEYWISHNLYVNNNSNEGNEYFTKKKQGRLIIGYVGSISYLKQCQKIIDLVSQDDRFELHFYGDGVSKNDLEKYAKSKNCSRITFFGSYKPEEKGEIIKSVDILFNAYGRGYPLVDCALSNKFYDALSYHKLVLTSPDTFMTEMCGPLAFPSDLNSGDLDALYSWYEALDGELINEYAASTLNLVKMENEATEKTIQTIFKGLEQ